MSTTLLAHGPQWRVLSSRLDPTPGGNLKATIEILLLNIQSISPRDLVVWIGSAPHRLSDDANVPLNLFNSMTLTLSFPVSVTVNDQPVPESFFTVVAEDDRDYDHA